MTRNRALLLTLTCGWLAAGIGGAAEPAPPAVVPTHPRILFRKDDLAALRGRCLTTHTREYAILKASGDRSAFLANTPVAPGLLYQLTRERRYLRYAESDYDAFHEALAPAAAKRLAGDILFGHRRAMGPDGAPALSAAYTRYMPLFISRSGVLAIHGDDVPLARPGELDGRLAALAARFGEAREVYNAVARRRGGKATTFHCACFFESGPKFFERWRVATGEDYFGDPLLAGSILQPMHNTYPLEHNAAPMTNAWGHDHLGRPADYILASRARDGLCQWVIHNPAWVSARAVGKPRPDDVDAMGRAWVAAIKGLGGYKETPSSGPVGWWPGHMPHRILYYDPALKEVPPESLPTSALFEGLGMACMRSSWRDDAVFARLHSGPNFRGEPPHLNDNTFILYHKGKLVTPEFSKGVLTSNASSVLVKDPDETIMVTGSCGGLWPDPVWDGKAAEIKPSKVNDGGQSYWTADIGRLNLAARGRISAYQATDRLTYAVGDATRSYNPAKLKHFTRQFLYLKPSLILICDRVVSTKPGFEKRWVLHTRGKPVPVGTGRTFMADAISTVKPVPTRGWDRTVGFDVPVAETDPHPKTTLRFETQWDGVEVGVVYKTGPEFGKVAWTCDGGKRSGRIDQHSETPEGLVETVLVRDLPKGRHVIELASPGAKMNYSFFSVRLGGRLFVTTLLPERFKREVTPDKAARESPYSRRADWRTDVVAETPRTDDVFLHVLEATDRSRRAPLAVKHAREGDRIVLRFTYAGRDHTVTFSAAGDVGGRVRISGAAGEAPVDRALPGGIVDRDDAHIAGCRAARKAHPLHDYEVSEIAHLTPRAKTAALVEALAEGKWHVRFYAVRALAAKADPAAAGKLTPLLADREPRVAAAAAEALGRLGAKASAPKLIASLASKQAEVRSSAAWALGELKAPGAVEPLIKLLADGDDFVAAAAADALATIGDRRAAGPLGRAGDGAAKTHMKAAYLWALASVGGDDARKRLEALRAHEDATLRACAVAGLTKLLGKGAAPALRQARSDAARDIQLFALRKLGEMGDASVVKELAAAAKDQQAKYPDRARAVDLLGRAGVKAAAEDLAALLADEKLYPYPYRRHAVSARAALALHRLGDRRGVAYLRQALLKGADPTKRHVATAAAVALASVDKAAAVPILMEGLAVRKTAVDANIVRSLYKLTRADPAGDLDIVGWRRSRPEVARWQQWWEQHKADFAQPGP